jgi:hypothetical protein
MATFSTIGHYLKDVFSDRLPFFPDNIRISLLIILFCVIAVLELYIFIIVKRIQKNNQQRQQKYWEQEVSNALTPFVLYDENEDMERFISDNEDPLLKIPLKNRIANQVITKEILTYHKSFTGSLKELFEVLYKRMHLEKITEKKIAHDKWDIKIEGIREAKEMKLYYLADEVLKYTDDENALLRMEAQAAFINLSPKKEPFRFLDRAQERILPWHQVVLFDLITKNKDIDIPSFSKWLRSENYTVILLCLNLVEHFLQFDAADDIEKLLKHKSPTVVKKAVKAIGVLELAQTEKSLFAAYFDQNDEIKIEILKTLGKITSGDFRDFLVSRIHANKYHIKREALYALKDHDKGNEILKELYQKSNSKDRLLIKHVLDERIVNA